MSRTVSLTDADLLGVEGLAAVVGRPGEVRRRGVIGAGARTVQDQSKLTQLTCEGWRRKEEREGGEEEREREGEHISNSREKEEQKE